MPLVKSSKDIWELCQKYLPKEERRRFDTKINFCFQERELRDRLVNSGKFELWKRWKEVARPIINNIKSSRYASGEYSKQKGIEYARRSENWYGTLITMINNEGFFCDSTLLNVGSNDGEEVADLPYIITCVDPSYRLCERGRARFPKINFRIGIADNLPFEDNSFDIYLSLRTWCVAGILPDEALLEAKRVLIPEGLLIVSFPLRFETQAKDLEHAVQDKIKPVAEWAYSLLSMNLSYIKTFSAPEDFFIYGRTKREHIFA